jgi:hypothetical protein
MSRRKGEDKGRYVHMSHTHGCSDQMSHTHWNNSTSILILEPSLHRTTLQHTLTFQHQPHTVAHTHTISNVVWQQLISPEQYYTLNNQSNVPTHSQRIDNSFGDKNRTTHRHK